MATQTTNYKLVKPEMTDVPDISAINPNWDTLDSKIKTVETNIDTNKTNIRSLTSKVDTNTRNITTNKNNISSLTTRVTTAEKNITTNKTNITNLTSNLSDLQQAASNDHNTIVEQQSKIEALETLSNTNKSNISSLTTNVNTNKNSISSLTTTVNSHTSTLNSFQSVSPITVSLYVATTGSDSTGTGTSGNPYKTISKAINMIPHNLSGKTYTVYVNSGTYSETVYIEDFHGGELNIFNINNSFSHRENVVLSGQIFIRDCTARICLSAFTIKNKNECAYVRSAVVYSEYVVYYSTSSASATGMNINGQSRVYLDTSYSTNCKYFIDANYNSLVCARGCIGNASVVYRAQNGAIITTSHGEITYTSSLYSTANGGRIYAGAQTSAGKY